MKTILILTIVLFNSKAISQDSACWKITEERKQIFYHYLSEKGNDFEIFLKATTYSGCNEHDLFLINRGVYKQYLLNKKIATPQSLIDTLKSHVERGITLTSNQSVFFSDFKINKQMQGLYDSLKVNPLDELISFFFSKDDGFIWPKYKHKYTEVFMLILYDYLIILQIAPEKIVPRFYIDLLRSGCFK